MIRRSVTLLDRGRNVVATADVEWRDGCYSGRIDLDPMPQVIRKVFEEYEEIVNDQIFSLLDRIEDQVANFSLSVAFSDGHEERVHDLQIFPGGETIVFRVTEPVEVSQGR